jgi:hypothetical protein
MCNGAPVAGVFISRLSSRNKSGGKRFAGQAAKIGSFVRLQQ